LLWQAGSGADRVGQTSLSSVCVLMAFVAAPLPGSEMLELLSGLVVGPLTASRKDRGLVPQAAAV
jgi:hypothetical protein